MPTRRVPVSVKQRQQPVCILIGKVQSAVRYGFDGYWATEKFGESLPVPEWKKVVAQTPGDQRRFGECHQAGTCGFKVSGMHRPQHL